MNRSTWWHHILQEQILCEAKTVVFHGTSDVFLSRILSQGLIAEPKNRVWDSGALASYTGVYITTLLSVARDAAEDAVEKFGGNKIIAVCQIETRSAMWDEDLLPGIIWRIVEMDRAEFIRRHKNEFYSLVKQLTDEMMKDFSGMGIHFHPAMEQVIRSKMQTFVYSFLGHVDLANITYQVLTKLQAHKDVRDAQESILKSLKEQSARVNSFRVADIGFSGANKIIGVVSAAPEPKIIWGNVSPEIVFDIKNMW